MCADFHRWAVRGTVEPHFPGPARGTHSDRDRRDTFRVHPPVDHAQILEGPSQLPPMQVLMGQRNPSDYHEPKKGTSRLMQRKRDCHMKEQDKDQLSKKMMFQEQNAREKSCVGSKKKLSPLAVFTERIPQITPWFL